MFRKELSLPRKSCLDWNTNKKKKKNNNKKTEKVKEKIIKKKQKEKEKDPMATVFPVGVIH